MIFIENRSNLKNLIDLFQIHNFFYTTIKYMKTYILFQVSFLPYPNRYLITIGNKLFFILKEIIF